MKTEIGRFKIRISPENDMDIAYIEEVLGLKKVGDECVVKRIAPIGLEHDIAYVEIKKREVDP